MSYIVAHDFGTSAAKAALFHTDGTLLAASSYQYKSYCPAPGCVEQDAEDWWKAFCFNNKALLKDHDPSEVLCVSFSGASPNCLLVDKAGRPLHRAMTWQDVRAAQEGREISAVLPAKFTARAPGGILGPDRTLCKLLWMRKYQPEIYAAAHKVLTCPSHYVTLKLTGAYASDYGVAAGTCMFSQKARDWDPEVLEIADIPKSLLPDLYPPTGVVGKITETAAAECGLPATVKVVAGTLDAVCTYIGAGLRDPGDVLLNGATSAEIMAIAADGQRISKPTSASGTSISWMRECLCTPEEDWAKAEGGDVFGYINDMVASAPAGSGGVIFLPYLSGERGVRYDPNAKGSFSGISLATTRAELVRAVVEGIGFNLDLNLNVIREAGIPVSRLPAVGGLVRSPAIRQVFADIMGVELVELANSEQAACAGAAVLGGIGIGLYADESAADLFIHTASVTRPDPDRHSLYRALAPRFEAVYQALKPIYNEKES